MAKIPIVLSIILAGIVVAGMHPPLSAASIACTILLMAGAVVLYHEMGVLDDPKPRRQGPHPRPYSTSYSKQYSRGPARMRTDRSATRLSWSYPGVVERRGDSIDL